MASHSAFNRRFRDPGIGVPRRLPLGELLLLVTLFSVVFRLLTLLGADGTPIFLIGVFTICVAIGQATLFGGDRPRDASILTGLVVCPALWFLLWVDSATVNVLGASIFGPGRIDAIGKFVSLAIVFAFLGQLFGYVAGMFIAGWFYLYDLCRHLFTGKERRSEMITKEHEQRLASENIRDHLRATLVDKVWRWISPRQATAQRTAILAFCYAILLGLVVTPFLPLFTILFPLQIALRILAFAIFAAFLSAGTQLRWWGLIIVVVLSILAAIPVAQELKQVIYFKELEGALGFLTFLLNVTSFVVGLCVAAIAGWFLVAFNRRIPLDKHQTRRIALVLSAAAIAAISFTTRRALQHYRNAPTQQLAAQVLSDGGDIAFFGTRPTALPWRPPVSFLQLTKRSGLHLDHIVTTFGIVATQSMIKIDDAGFVDEHLMALNNQSCYELNVTGSSLTDDAFSGMTDFGVNSLVLSNTKVGTKTIQRLAEMPSMPQNLIQLQARHTQIDRLIGFEKVTRLSYLDLSGCPITNAEFAGQTAIKTLILCDCPIGDRQLEEMVKSLHQVKTLDLSRTNISDAGLKFLWEMINLESLSLQETSVTDAGMKHLSELSCLERLTLDGTNITDKGLAILAEFDTLEQISVKDTKVTRTGLDRLPRQIDVE